MLPITQWTRAEDDILFFHNNGLNDEMLVSFLSDSESNEDFLGFSTKLNNRKTFSYVHYFHILCLEQDTFLKISDCIFLN